MKSFISTTAALSTLLSAVSAQYAIDPNSVSQSTRQAWCLNQESQCPLICLQTAAASADTESNTCDPTDLTFSCVCSNGLSPNVSEYSQTLPYYICQEWGNQCVSNCGEANNACAADCRNNHPCGALNPTRVNTTSSSAGGASTTTASTLGLGASGEPTAAQVSNSQGVIYTGLAGAAATTGPSGGNGGGDAKSAGVRSVQVWALGFGQTFGTLGVMGALVGGMAVLL